MVVLLDRGSHHLHPCLGTRPVLWPPIQFVESEQEQLLGWVRRYYQDAGQTIYRVDLPCGVPYSGCNRDASVVSIRVYCNVLQL